MLTRREAKAQGRERDYYTIEHFTKQLISYCCNGCNASRQKSLPDWFETPYCLTRNINEETVSEMVREWLRVARNGGGEPGWKSCAGYPTVKKQLAFSF